MKSAVPILLTAIFLFYLGAFFCYFVTLAFWGPVPLGLSVRPYQADDLRGKYVSFCAFFVFGFGLTFELPLILALLSYLRVVQSHPF